MKYTKIRIHMRELWSREHTLLFRETFIYSIFHFGRFPFFRNSFSLSLSYTMTKTSPTNISAICPPNYMKLVLFSSSLHPLHAYTKFFYRISLYKEKSRREKPEFSTILFNEGKHWFRLCKKYFKIYKKMT